MRDKIDLEAAQIASEAETKQQKKNAEKLDTEAVEQGDFGPIVAIDEEWGELSMTPPVMDWLFEGAKNRICVLEFVRLKDKCAKWFGQPAKDHFAELKKMVVQKESAEAAGALLETSLAELQEVVYCGVYMFCCFVLFVCCALYLAAARAICGAFRLPKRVLWCFLGGW